MDAFHAHNTQSASVDDDTIKSDLIGDSAADDVEAKDNWSLESDDGSQQLSFHGEFDGLRRYSHESSEEESTSSGDGLYDDDDFEHYTPTTTNLQDQLESLDLTDFCRNED